MAAKVPRLAGRTLRLVAALLRSPAGSALRRAIGVQILDRHLAGLDLATVGNPAPLYWPPTSQRSTSPPTSQLPTSQPPAPQPPTSQPPVPQPPTSQPPTVK